MTAERTDFLTPEPPRENFARGPRGVEFAILGIPIRDVHI